MLAPVAAHAVVFAAIALLLASAGLGYIVTRIDWRQAFKGCGVILGVTVALFIFSAFNLMATMMLGLVVVVPWLAHASWHAYRDLVRSAASPEDFA